MSKNYVGFASFGSSDADGAEASWVSLGPTIEAVKSAVVRFKEGPPAIDSTTAQETVDVESEVGRGIWAFYSQLKAYYEVAAVVEIIPKTFIKNFFKRQMQDHAVANFAQVDTEGGVPVYGLDIVDIAYINQQLDRWDSITDGFHKLPASILLSLVAGFDSAFADFAKVLLRSKPERYEGSDRQYTVSEILKLDSLEQIVSKAADDEIDGLMNKSHPDQIAFFERSFGVSIKDHYDRWPNFVEIFERRNLAAHGSLRVNERYLDNCKKAGVADLAPIGTVLEVDGKYLKSCINILIEFGILLALSAWQKQYPKSILESFGAVVEVSYSLLKDDHALVAARILEYGLKVKSKGADEEKTKMMIINLAIAHKQNGHDKQANDLLAKTDWSASPPQFKLCSAAIREDAKTAATFLQAAKVSDSLMPFHIREWPAFQWIRDNEDFRLSCEECFGEPLFPVKVVNANVSSTDADGAGS